MNEIIDLFISLLYIVRYDSWVNKYRNFQKKINMYDQLEGSAADVYRCYVANEIKSLKVKPYSEGRPYYAIFEKSKTTMRVFVINENFQFMYRLEDYNSITNSFYCRLD